MSTTNRRGGQVTRNGKTFYRRGGAVRYTPAQKAIAAVAIIGVGGAAFSAGVGGLAVVAGVGFGAVYTVGFVRRHRHQIKQLVRRMKRAKYRSARDPHRTGLGVTTHSYEGHPAAVRKRIRQENRRSVDAGRRPPRAF